MKLKTSLIAAATLAVGVISSQAQVYSQNIVGYYNLTITNGALYNSPCIQLSVGSSNGLNEVFSTFSTNQSGDIVYLWDQVSQSFKGGGYYFYWDPTINSPIGGGSWYDQQGNGNLVTNFPSIKPGYAFYLQGNGVASSDMLTIAGTVSIASGSSGTNGIVNNSLYSFQGSQLPMAGGLYNLGLTPPDGTLVYIWNTPSQSFKGSGYYFYSGVTGGAQGGWYDQQGNGNVVTNTGVLFTNGGFTFSDIPVNVGDGYYIQAPASNGTGTTNWVQNLPSN